MPEWWYFDNSYAPSEHTMSNLSLIFKFQPCLTRTFSLVFDACQKFLDNHANMNTSGTYFFPSARQNGQRTLAYHISTSNRNEEFWTNGRTEPSCSPLASKPVAAPHRTKSGLRGSGPCWFRSSADFGCGCVIAHRDADSLHLDLCLEHCTDYSSNRVVLHCLDIYSFGLCIW